MIRRRSERGVSSMLRSSGCGGMSRSVWSGSRLETPDLGQLATKENTCTCPSRT